MWHVLILAWALIRSPAPPNHFCDSNHFGNWEPLLCEPLEQEDVCGDMVNAYSPELTPRCMYVVKSYGNRVGWFVA
jgi:hypothetical protein